MIVTEQSHVLNCYMLKYFDLKGHFWVMNSAFIACLFDLFLFLVSDWLSYTL